MLSLVYNAYFIAPNCSAQAKVESAAQIFGTPRLFWFKEGFGHVSCILRAAINRVSIRPYIIANP